MLYPAMISLQHDAEEVGSLETVMSLDAYSQATLMQGPSLPDGGANSAAGGTKWQVSQRIYQLRMYEHTPK